MLIDTLWVFSNFILLTANYHLSFKLIWGDNFFSISAVSQLGLFISYILRLVHSRNPTELVFSIISIVPGLINVTVAWRLRTPEFDTTRFDECLPTLIGLLSAIVLNTTLFQARYSFFFFLEALSMIPQLRFTKNAGHLNVSINRYFLTIMAYKIFELGSEVIEEDVNIVQITAGFMFIFFCMCVLGQHATGIKDEINGPEENNGSLLHLLYLQLLKIHSFVVEIIEKLKVRRVEIEEATPAELE